MNVIYPLTKGRETQQLRLLLNKLGILSLPAPT